MSFWSQKINYFPKYFLINFFHHSRSQWVLLTVQKKSTYYFAKHLFEVKIARLFITSTQNGTVGVVDNLVSVQTILCLKGSTSLSIHNTYKPLKGTNSSSIHNTYTVKTFWKSNKLLLKMYQGDAAHVQKKARNKMKMSNYKRTYTPLYTPLYSKNI